MGRPFLGRVALVVAGLVLAVVAGNLVTVARGGSPSSSASPVDATDEPSDLPTSWQLLTLVVCKPESNGWRAGGTAANPRPTPARVTVTVFFTTLAGTVLRMGRTELTVPPLATEPWNVTAVFPAPQATRCVLGVVG